MPSPPNDTQLPQQLLRSLSKLTEQIHALIDNTKHAVAADLRSEGRSRLARLVEALPNPTSEQLRKAAERDLPLASHALALASASCAIFYTQQQHFTNAVQAADVSMVMLGMPAAASIRALVELIDTHNLATKQHHFVNDPHIATITIPHPKLDHINTTECPQVNAENFTLDQFVHFFQNDKPVVIRGCAASWPAIQNWKSPQYLGTRYGHRTVPVEFTAAASDHMQERFSSLQSVIQMMLQPRTDQSPTVYLAQHPLFNYIPALERDIIHPKYMNVVGKQQADLVNVWMGTAGSGSKLHFDSADNFLTQVVGDKHVLLISPDQAPFIYQKSPTHNVSPLNVEHPDTTKYPLFKQVRAEVATLRPGDALYIPSSHWHWVKALTGSISVNFWF